MKLNKLKDLALTVLVLLVLPYESRTLLFATQPADWYGELLLSLKEGSLIVAKNSSDTRVAFNLEGVGMHASLGPDSATHGRSGETEVAPLSVSIAVSSGSGSGSEGRVVETASGVVFSPGPLHLQTRSDRYGSFLGLLALAAAFSALSFSCARYINERLPEIFDEEEGEGEQSGR